MRSAKRLLSKTLPFILAKLALGGVSIGISVLLVLFVQRFIYGTVGYRPSFWIWAVLSLVITFLITSYLSYTITAGHVAVAAEAAGTGRIPAHQLSWGKKHVKRLFPVADQYYALRRQIGRSIRELQASFGRNDIKSSILPDLLSAMGITPLVVRLFLRYMDECCMGWLFFRRKGNLNQNAVNSVAIYGQNRWSLLSNVTKILLKSAILTGVAVLAAFLPLGIIFRTQGWHLANAFVFALQIGWIAKFALLDSYIMIRSMINYIRRSQPDEDFQDSIETFCQLSPSLRKLRRKVQ